MLHFIMSEFLYSFCLRFLATSASKCLYSISCTGWRSCYRSAIPAVSLCWDFCLLNENRITYRAVLSFRKPCISTSWFNGRVNNLGMSGCRNCLCLRCFTGCAGIGLYAFSCTGWRSRYLSAIPAVSLCRNNFLFSENCITYWTVLAFSQSSLRTGCFNCWVDHFGVALGWNFC